MSNLAQFNKDIIQNDKAQTYIQQVLGEQKQSFVANLTALVSNSVALQECEPITVMYAAMKATALNLPLDQNLGYAYVIPYKDNKAKTVKAQFQIGYKGFKQLAQRSDQFVILNDDDVREGEIKSRNRLTGEIVFEFIQDDSIRAKTPIIGYFSYFKLKSGFSSMVYMTVKEVEEHAGMYSQSYKSGYGVWKDKFSQMARKTVCKLNLSRNAPLSVDLITAIKYDQAIVEPQHLGIVSDEERITYIDNNDSGNFVITLEDLTALYEAKKPFFTEKDEPFQADCERIISAKEEKLYSKLYKELQKR